MQCVQKKYDLLTNKQGINWISMATAVFNNCLQYFHSNGKTRMCTGDFHGNDGLETNVYCFHIVTVIFPLIFETKQDKNLFNFYSNTKKVSKLFIWISAHHEWCDVL